MDHCSQMFIIPIITDDTSRFAATFTVSLVSVATGDGLIGSTPTSGASIDPLTSSVNVSLMDRNYPYGLVQFSTYLPPTSDNASIPVANEKPQVIAFLLNYKMQTNCYHINIRGKLQQLVTLFSIESKSLICTAN